MKLTATVFAFLAATAIADNCKQGLDYCGSSLLKKGNYKNQIAQALYDAGHGDWDGDDVLFACLGGPNGNIEFIRGCGGGCRDNGSGNSDACR